MKLAATPEAAQEPLYFSAPDEGSSHSIVTGGAAPTDMLGEFYEQSLALARAERRSVLKRLVPQDPSPSEYGRRARVDTEIWVAELPVRTCFRTTKDNEFTESNPLGNSPSPIDSPLPAGNPYWISC